MKFLTKTIVSLLFLYLLFWGGVAAYFTYADRYKGLLESNLSSIFDRDVSIDNVETVWRGFSPRLKVEGFEVAGDSSSEPALAFESLSAVLSPSSMLTFWPSFTEFTIQKPLIEIVSLENNQLRIGGLNLSNQRRNVGVSQRVVSWLLDQQNAQWVEGEVVWRRDENRVHRYQDIQIDYSRTLEKRVLKASVNTPKGLLAFTAKTNGDLISDSQWDASLEVEGEGGERLLTSDDFSVSVDNGQGRVLLKTLDVERIRDFIKLTGLAGEAGWLLDAKLMGRLHDVHLDFSGPLLNIETWSLAAAASDIGFKSVGRAPAMNNLSGELKASASGGKFIFAARSSEFTWSRWYDKSFAINRAMGEFSWEIDPTGIVNVSVSNGEFEDRNARISNIQATVTIDAKARKVSNFGELFKVDSVSDLSYTSSGEVVDGIRADNLQAPVTVDASAEFDVFEMKNLVDYLPNNSKLNNFRSWSKNAFLSGQVTNGMVSYKGEVSATAFAQGKADLDASADFSDVTVDYAPQFDWPPARRGIGSATLKNELLTILPSEIWLNGDPLSDAQLQITSLFQKGRALKVRGKTTTSLVKGMEFLFQGPLIKPENRPSKMPIMPESGWVDISTEVNIVLNDVANLSVNGTAEVRSGSCLLPEGVLVSDIGASVVFTERKIESNNVRATFLGGETRGRVVTVKEMQPPVVKLIATGVAKAETLKPWIGEHVLTWIQGEAPWQGSMLFDRNRIEISGVSNLEGIEVTAPAPLKKEAKASSNLNLSMVIGGDEIEQLLSIEYGDLMSAHFRSNLPSASEFKSPTFFDNSLISVGGNHVRALKPGVNFSINHSDINLDDWLSAVIDLAAYEPEQPADNTDFLDAMRTVNIVASNPVFLGREFGSIDATAVSVDGEYWIGSLSGENVDGTLQMEPRADVGKYDFKLSHLIIGEDPNPGAPLEAIDYSLKPSELPSIALDIDSFRLAGKSLGSMSLRGKPQDDQWLLDSFELKHNGINTTASGNWVNNKEFGSISRFEFNTVIDEAEGAFNDMDFDGIIKKGEGSVTGEVRWIGAPHEFDYGRLNGEFDAFIKDGELVKIEPGGGKLVGLLNFNAIARRLVFDFRDVFAAGFKFDRMRYAGAFADGEAILSEAFVLAPAAFVRMEGKVDLNKELVDLEVHVSPELGGNLALLSALANPAAGAFVFLTQRIFKDEVRNSSFKSYRALGTWEDFEMVEIDGAVSQADDTTKTPENTSDLKQKLDSSDVQHSGNEQETHTELEPVTTSEPSADVEPSAEPKLQSLTRDIESSRSNPKL